MENQQEKRQEEKPEKEKGSFYNTWPENLRLFLEESESCGSTGKTYDLMNSFYRDVIDGAVDVFGISVTINSSKIEEICLECINNGYSAGLRIGYAFAHYLDEPLRRFQKEAEIAGDQEFKKLTEIFKEFREKTGNTL